ncbi:MAG: sulfite exporter TauE/SafE family protein [Lentisphaeria bacterium]|nr:sulfite exporter TauE/SafE family protein [Lentisphaeria bacterium]
MMEWFFSDYTGHQLWMLVFSSLLIGITKTGIPGLGMLAVVLLAGAFPARESTGLQLVLLACTDIVAVLWYRRDVQWPIVLRLLPWALGGIALGSLAMRFITDEMMRPILAWVVLGLVIFSYVFRYWDRLKNLPSHWGYPAFFGMTAGLTTQVANAAGPVMTVYLLSMKLDKNKYMGSVAWYFLILNWIKVPVFFWEGRITETSVRANLGMLPVLLIGAALGVLILKYIPQRYFEHTVQLLAALAALKLLLPF